MKFKFTALGVVAACSLLAGPAAAQQIRQPEAVLPVAFDSYDYYSRSARQPDVQPSPSDLPLPPPGAAVPEVAPHHVGCGCAIAPACGCEAACDPCATACCDDGCGNTCFLFGDDEPITAFPNAGAWAARGWFQVGYHTQGANGIGTGLFNDYPNRVQLHQAYGYVEKSLDLECNDWDWGFRGDYVYGTDGPDTQAFGQPTGWDTGWTHGEAYGHAIPQLYGEIGMGDLTVKAGKFYTLVGYEVVTAPDNFFYSHAFTQYLAEPFTHTGVLASYNMNEWLTVHGGWTLGWDTGFDSAGGNTFLGGFSAQIFDNVNFTYITTMGDFGFDNVAAPGVNGSDTNGYSHSCVLVWDISDRLQYVFQSDYIDNDIFLGGTRDLIGANQYLTYRLNDCWAVGGRLEWFDDPRFEDEITALTLGLNYRPHANVILRPEVRWDWYEANAVHPVEGTPLVDSTLFGIDCIVTW